MSNTALRAVGQWRDILTQLGIPSNILDGKHHPCPLCKAGKDRFRFTDKDGRGLWICNVCGTGDGLEFLRKFKCIEFREAARMVDGIIGKGTPEKVEWTPAMKIRAMDRIWRTSKPMHPRDPAGRYLINRVGITIFPETLRTTAQNVKHREGGIYSCMLAMLSGANGRAVMVHRTYLTQDGEKAPVEKPKMFMPGNIPDGSAVRLGPVGETIAIAEGIETALSFTKLYNITCWATCSTGVMMKWTPPEGVKRVIIAPDNDPNWAGHAAAYTLAHRICETVDVEVRLPPSGDWNDVLRTKYEEE